MERWLSYENMPKLERIRKSKEKQRMDDSEKITQSHRLTCQRKNGDVCFVFNPLLGIPRTKRDTHPGVVVGEGTAYVSARISPGTDAQNRPQNWLWINHTIIIINPDHQNGLKKQTAFRKEPTEVPLNDLKTIIGRLSRTDLARFF